MARIPASEATRKRIEAMISGEGEAVEKSELVRAAARLIVDDPASIRRTPGYAAMRLDSKCAGVRYPIDECKRR